MTLPELTQSEARLREAFESGPGRDYDDRTTRALSDYRATVEGATLAEVYAEIEALSMGEQSPAPVLTLALLVRRLRSHFPSP